MDPTVVYWSGVVAAILIYLVVICRIVDGIWDLNLTDMVIGGLWDILLRPVIHWSLALLVVTYAAATLVAVVFTFETPWKSLGWALLAIPLLRILIWLFWLSDEDASTLSWARNIRAQQQNIHGWDRFWLWCFCWGEHEGLLTQKEKAYWREQKKKAHEEASAD